MLRFTFRRFGGRASFNCFSSLKQSKYFSFGFVGFFLADEKERSTDDETFQREGSFLLDDLKIALNFRKEGDFSRALEHLRKSAIAGNSRAMLHLGFAFSDGGWNLKKDDEESCFWFRESAKLGNGVGMIMYAAYLEEGIGTKQDENEAQKWSKMAFKTNDFLAKGLCYGFGIGVQKSSKYKKYYLLKSAIEDDEFGQYW